MSRIHVERRLAATCDIDPALRVRCSPEDLDEILGNLLENAFKWAKSAIAISAEAAGGEIIVTIQDDGPGMPDAKINDAFLPGTRVDETVPGDGFGLSIARELAGLYGGTVNLRNGQEGGLRCTLILPRAG